MLPKSEFFQIIWNKRKGTVSCSVGEGVLLRLLWFILLVASAVKWFEEMSQSLEAAVQIHQISYDFYVLPLTCAKCQLRKLCFTSLARSQNCKKGTISFVISVRLSAWNNSVSIGRSLMKFGIGVFFEKPLRIGFVKMLQE